MYVEATPAMIAVLSVWITKFMSQESTTQRLIPSQFRVTAKPLKLPGWILQWHCIALAIIVDSMQEYLETVISVDWTYLIIKFTIMLYMTVANSVKLKSDSTIFPPGWLGRLRATGSDRIDDQNQTLHAGHKIIFLRYLRRMYITEFPAIWRV